MLAWLRRPKKLKATTLFAATMSSGYSASAVRYPTFYVSHGGGPWIFMKDDDIGQRHALLEKSLNDIPRQIGFRKPRAILMVSAHWEEEQFMVMGSPNPPMLYDYGGFPHHTYEVKYSAPGHPDVAARVCELLQKAGLSAHVDAKRGFDHGAFVPLYAIYPEADVPVVQLSIRSDYEPAAHVAAGRALAPLRDEGVLIIGSGLSFHNMREFFNPRSNATASAAFDSWLQETIAHTKSKERSQMLIDWESAPAARYCHPQEDHFMPVHVAAGAGEDEQGFLIYSGSETYGGRIHVSSYRFGEELHAEGHGGSGHSEL